jgi:uncharacterized membrane protein YdjX (TVP38/TMEM64 family)
VWPRIVATLAAVAAFAAVVWLIGRSFEAEDLLERVDELRLYGRRWWAPAALIAAMIVVNLTGLPGTPLTLASGIVWGWLAGGAWMMVATMIGTAVPYLLTLRRLPRAREKLERRLGTAFEWLERSGLAAVAILRLVHIFPFAVISYAAGIARVRPRHYFAGTFFGTLPGIFIYTYLADSILLGAISMDDAKRRIIAASALLAIFTLVTNLIALRIDQHRNGAS